MILMLEKCATTRSFKSNERLLFPGVFPLLWNPIKAVGGETETKPLFVLIFTDSNLKRQKIGKVPSDLWCSIEMRMKIMMVMVVIVKMVIMTKIILVVTMLSTMVMMMVFNRKKLDVCVYLMSAVAVQMEVNHQHHFSCGLLVFLSRSSILAFKQAGFLHWLWIENVCCRWRRGPMQQWQIWWISSLIPNLISDATKISLLTTMTMRSRW